MNVYKSSIASTEMNLHPNSRRKPLMDQTIRIYGEINDILSLKRDLETQFADHNIKISEPKPYTARLGTRRAYRQNELFEIIIAITINLATSAAYDHFKMILKKHKDNKKIEIRYQ